MHLSIICVMCALGAVLLQAPPLDATFSDGVVRLQHPPTWAVSKPDNQIWIVPESGGIAFVTLADFESLDEATLTYAALAEGDPVMMELEDEVRIGRATGTGGEVWLVRELRDDLFVSMVMLLDDAQRAEVEPVMVAILASAQAIPPPVDTPLTVPLTETQSGIRTIHPEGWHVVDSAEGLGLSNASAFDAEPGEVGLLLQLYDVPAAETLEDRFLAVLGANITSFAPREPLTVNGREAVISRDIFRNTQTAVVVALDDGRTLLALLLHAPNEADTATPLLLRILDTVEVEIATSELAE